MASPRPHAGASGVHLNPHVAAETKPFDSRQRDEENAWDGTPLWFHRSFVGRPPSVGQAKSLRARTPEAKAAGNAPQASSTRPSTALASHLSALVASHEQMGHHDTSTTAHHPGLSGPISSTLSRSSITKQSAQGKPSLASSLECEEQPANTQHLTQRWGEEGTAELQTSAPSAANMMAGRLQLTVSVPSSPRCGPDTQSCRSPSKLFSPSTKFRTMQSKTLKALASPTIASKVRSRPPPPDLVSKEDIPDDEMRQLFKEVQELSAHSSVSEALRAKQDLKQLYARYSQRYTHLPCALVTSVNQNLTILPLPGPRGVQGFMVDHQGRVLHSRKRLIGPYLAATKNAMGILDELRDLESGTPEPCPGLEGDAELVKLWRSKGGSPARHDPFLPNLTQQPSKPREALQPARSNQLSAKPKQGEAASAEAGGGGDLASRQSSGRLSHQTSGVPEVARARSTSLASSSTMDRQPSLPSPALMLQPKQQKRLVKKTVGQNASGINPVSGQPLGFYQHYVKDILEMGQPEELAPAQQVAFRSNSPEATGKAADSHGLNTEGSSDTDDVDPTVWDAWDASSDGEQPLPTTAAAAAATAAPGDMLVEPSALDLHSTSCSAFASSAAQQPAELCEPGDEQCEGDAAVQHNDQADAETQAAQEHAAVEAAWKLVQAALAVGRRTKMKSRPNTSSHKRPGALAPPQPADKRGGGSPHMSHNRDHISPVPSDPDSARSTAKGSSSQVTVDEQQAAAEAAIQGFLDAWTTGKSVGEIQIMSIARLKELLLAADEASPTPGSFVEDPAKWKEKLAAWVPSQEEQERLIKLMSSAPEFRVHKHTQPAHVPKPWLSPDLVQRAMLPGSAVTLPGPPAGPPGLHTQQRFTSDNNIEKGEHLKGSVQLSGDALLRRLQQLTSCGETELDLGLVSRVSRADMGIVYQALQSAPAITCLKACDNLLDSGSVQGLLALLSSCTTLKSVDISNNAAFSSEAGDALGNLLHPRHKLNLTHLNLHGCPITDEGFHSLALGVQFNKVLKSLDLSDCKLTDAGLAAMDAVLEQNVVLLHLNMSSNAFTAKGISQLFKDLQGNVALTHLALASCALDDACAAAVAQVLPMTAALELLDLSHNQITHVGAAHLGEAIARLETPLAMSRPHAHSPGARQSRAGGASHSGSLSQSTRVTASGEPAQRSGAPGDQSRRVTAAGDQSRRVTLAGDPSRQATTATDGTHPSRRVTAAGEECRSRRVTTAGESSWCGITLNNESWVGQDGCCPLHTLLLHGNPLGMAGTTHLFKGLNALQGGDLGSPLTVLGLHHTEVAVAGPTAAASNATRATWDPLLPCGTYCLQLANAEHRQIAGTLVSHGLSKHITWLSAKLDGQPLGAAVLPPAAWVHKLPAEGLLQVKVLRCTTVPPDSPIASDLLLRVVTRLLGLSSTPDMRREDLITCLCSVAFVTSHVVAQLLACFEYPHARVTAAVELLGSCTDVHRLVPVLLSTASTHSTGELQHVDEEVEAPSSKRKAPKHGVLTPGEVCMLLNKHPVQLWRHTPGKRPVNSWMQLVACGQYRLDLGQQAERVLASCILGLSAAVQQRVSLASGASTGLGASQLILQTWGDAVHVGLLNSLLRNVRYQGKPLEPLPCQISSSHLPHSGYLDMDVNLPRLLLTNTSTTTPMALSPTPAQPTARAPSPLSPKVAVKVTLPDEQRPSADGRKPAGITAAAAAAAKSFCVGANPDARPGSGLQRLASMSSATTRMAAGLSLLKSTSMSGRQVLPPRVAAAAQRRAAQASAWTTLYQQCLMLVGISSQDIRIQGWQKCTGSWTADSYLATLKAWRQNAAGRFEQLAAERRKQKEGDQEPAEQAPANPTKVKGKSKGKTGGKAGGKGSKEAARAAALAAELRANREAVALKAATEIVPLITQFIAESQINALQLLHLMQLLPSLDMRMALLTRARPCLVDTHHMLDLTMCLTISTPLSDGAPVTTSDRGPVSPGTTAAHAHSEIPGMDQHNASEDRPQTPTLPGSKGLWMSPRLDIVLPGVEAPDAGSSPTSVPPAASKAAPATRGAKAKAAQAPEPSPSAPLASNTLGLKKLMQLVVDKLGINALGLVWAAPDGLKAFLRCLCVELEEGEAGVTLDMNNTEQMQLAMQIARWCDLARGTFIMCQPLQACTTDAGQLPLEHEGMWSYWEQVLGWLCCRAATASANYPVHVLPDANLLLLTPGPESSRASAPAGAADPAVNGSEPAPASDGPAKLGKLQLLWASTPETLKHAAATMVQAVWRGWRTRRGLAAALAAEAQTVEDACVVGDRWMALPEHLITMHVPMIGHAPESPTLTSSKLTSRQLSMNSEASSEPEFVQPLTPLYMDDPAASDTTADTPKSGSGPAGFGRLNSRAPSLRLMSFGSRRLSSPPATQRRKPQFSFMGQQPRDLQVFEPELEGTDEVDWQEMEHATWAKAVRRWQAAWAQLKFWRRVSRLERLAGPIQRRHALREMAANADHLFPAGGPSAASEH